MRLGERSISSGTPNASTRSRACGRTRRHSELIRRLTSLERWTVSRPCSMNQARSSSMTDSACKSHSSASTVLLSPSSIARTFEFVQTRWANREDFQQSGDGRDPLISQDTNPRTFNLPGHGTLNFEQWVFTTGGAYLVSLSLTGLNALASA